MGESCYVIKSHLKMSFFLKFPVAVNNIYLALLCHCQKSVQLSSCLTRKRTSWHVMQKMSNNVEPRQTMSLLFVREVWQPVQSWFLILQMQQFLLKCSQPWNENNLKVLDLVLASAVKTGLPALNMVEVIRVEQTRLWCQNLNGLLIHGFKDTHWAGGGESLLSSNPSLNPWHVSQIQRYWDYNTGS